MTFTVLALDASRTAIGIATASCSLALGAVVPAIDPRVGVVASQAWTNPELRGMLLRAAAAGGSPATAIAGISAWDDEPGLRQAALLAVDGRGAAHTGADTSAWAGHRVSDGIVVLGNLLAGSHVLDAMQDGFVEHHGADELAVALVRALRAGDVAGGDARGRQSAALLVAPIDGVVRYDLRVDDHVDPVAELARLVSLRAADAVSARTA